MKKIAFLVCFFLFSIFSSAQNSIVLPELLNPESIQVDDIQFYIAEATSVYIYDLKTFNLVNKFGKEGEGPQEFKILPFLPLFINITDRHIVVNSFGKLSRFDKKGQWITEEKVKGGYIFFIMSLGEYLVGQGVIQEGNDRCRTINLYDKKLNKLKEICRVMDDFKGPGKGYDVLEKRFRHQTFEGQLLVCQEKQFIIDIYDVQGNKKSAIRLDYDPVPMTEKDRELITDYLKNSSRTKAFFPLFKPLRFPEYYPAVMNLYAANEKLYVLTWKRKDGKTEFFIFNKKGKLIKHLFLPLVFQSAIEPSPFAIHNGQLFQLVENEETNNWELHINIIN